MEPLEQQATLLHNLIENEPNNFEKAKGVIDNLKSILCSYPFLDPNANITAKDSCLIRQFYEDVAIFGIRSGDMEEFERALALLKCGFLRPSDLPPSERLPLLIAADLIHINSKSKNESSDFHLELEIARSVIGDNDYLNYAEALQQSLNDNSFSRLFDLESKPPSPLFNIFTASLLEGARSSHAESIEKSYEYLTIENIKDILHFNTIEEAEKFADSRGWRRAEENPFIIQFSQKEKAKSQENMVARSVDLAVQISALA